MVVSATDNSDVAGISPPQLRGGASRRLAAGGALDHWIRDDVVRVLNRFPRTAAKELDASAGCEGKNAA